MTKKKFVYEEKTTMRDTFRSMKPGMSLEWKVDKPRKIASVHAAITYLNRLEPESGLVYSGQSFPTQCKVIVTCKKRGE